MQAVDGMELITYEIEKIRAHGESRTAGGAPVPLYVVLRRSWVGTFQLRAKRATAGLADAV